MEALLEGHCRICLYLHWEMGIVLCSCHGQYNCSRKLGFRIVSFTPNDAVFVVLVWCPCDP